MTDSASPTSPLASEPAAPPPAGPRRPSSPPGAKRARHQRWTRISTVVTLVGLAAFVAFLVWVVPRFQGKTDAEIEQEGCVSFLDGIAKQVTRYAEQKGKMPRTLADLRDPEIGAEYDAEPWDCWNKPIEYRVLDGGARTFLLRSLGPDKLPDTADDIGWPSGAVWE